MRQIKVFMLVWAAVGLAACSSDDNDINDKDRVQSLPLTITVSETPLRNTDDPASVRSTRAAVTTTSTLTEFTLDYQYVRGADLQHGSYQVQKDGAGNWSGGYWPTDAGNDTNVSWYAHTGGTMPDEENYINFTVEELASKQNDLLVATATGTQTSTGGNLNFTFDHACTALRFYVKKATNLNDYTLTLTSIKLCNVVNQGSYSFTNNSWTLGTNRSVYTLYEGFAVELGSENYILLNANEDDFLFMIPQELTALDTSTAISSATDQTYIMIECSLRKNGEETNTYDGMAYIPFGANLQAGYQNDVKINIGMNSLYSVANTKIIQ